MENDFKKIEKEVKTWFLKHEYTKNNGKIHLSEPVFSSKEIISVLKVLLLSNGWIAQGPKVEEFEKKFAKYIGVRYAIATNSGSSANLLGLATLIEKGKLKKGDEVIIPSATFPTVATPVVQLGLVPVFVDVRKDGNIDPFEIKKAINKKTKLIMVVHTLGKPADIKSIKKVIKGRNVFIFEDSCEAHGAQIGNGKVGSFGIMASFSFYVAHNMTTAEGGMLVTNDIELVTVARSLRDFGRYMGNDRDRRFSVKDSVLGNYDTRYLFSRIGYNLRMTDIQAALGIVQLEKLESMNNKRRKIASYYLRHFKTLEKYFYLPEEENITKSVYYGFLMVIKETAPFKRAELVDFLEKKSIETRPLFGGCLPDQPAFRDIRKKVIGRLKISRLIRDNAIFIACHPGISLKDAEYMYTSINDFLIGKNLKEYRYDSSSNYS